MLMDMYERRFPKMPILEVLSELTKTPNEKLADILQRWNFNSPTYKVIVFGEGQYETTGVRNQQVMLQLEGALPFFSKPKKKLHCPRTRFDSELV